VLADRHAATIILDGDDALGIDRDENLGRLTGGNT